MGGSRYERQLVRALTACDRPALRVPTSGSATDRDLPDVLAGTRVEVGGLTGPIATWSDAWCIEVKSTSAGVAYADDSEIEALARFAGAFGAAPFVGVKFKRGGGTRSPHWLVPPRACRTTDSGAYAVSESDVEDVAAWAVYPATENQDATVEGVA